MIGIIKNYKYYLVSMAVLSLIIFGMSIGRKITKASGHQQPGLYGRLEEMKRVRHLELVSYYYESMVEVEHEEREDRAYLLLIIPAKVSCYLDLEKVEFVMKDSGCRVPGAGLINESETEMQLNDSLADLPGNSIVRGIQNLGEMYLRAFKSVTVKTGK